MCVCVLLYSYVCVCVTGVGAQDCEYCSKVSNQQLWKKLQEEESAGEQVRKLEQDVSSHLDGSPTLVNLLFVDRLSRERDEHRSRWGRTLKTLVMVPLFVCCDACCDVCVYVVMCVTYIYMCVSMRVCVRSRHGAQLGCMLVVVVCRL